MPKEKATCKLHKDAVCCFEQILEVALNKTVGPLTSYLTNHPSKMSKTCKAILDKNELISDIQITNNNKKIFLIQIFISKSCNLPNN